jgi:hypothetical protein
MLENHFIEGSGGRPVVLTGYLFGAERSRLRMGDGGQPAGLTLNPLICRCFDGGSQKTVNLSCTAT